MSRHDLAVRRENAGVVSKGDVALWATASLLQVFLSLLIRYKSEPG